MILEFARKAGFWALDAVRGGKVKAEYDDIKKAYQDKKPNLNALTDILTYAVQTVPFYSKIEKPELSVFPVMSKPIYKEQQQNCISKDYVSVMDELYVASTSGSTGTPLKVYQDSGKRTRHNAEMIFFNTLIGWNLGDHYVFIRNWVSNYKQSKIKNFSQNVTNISVSEFDDNKKGWLCSHLRKNKRSILFGYSSAICDFLNYVRKNDIDGKELELKLIVCDSDELTDKNKEMLEQVFGCSVINRYDNEENGLLATSLPEENKLMVNYPSLYIELLKPECDEPVQKGELGRVVITDLFNKAMPLIRYDTGDYAISDDEGEIVSLRMISGRKADSLYSVDGKIISSVAISGITEIFTEIEKYQIIQKNENSFEFNYVGKLSENNEKMLLERLRDSLGKNAVIKLKIVSAISTGKNGKFKTTVNEWLKNEGKQL